MRKENIYNEIEKNIMNTKMDEVGRNKLLKNLMRFKTQKLNIMVTGATGCGKSSTINALFETEVAKVGVGVEPETMEIEMYVLDNLVLWDTPGLGDGNEADNRHSKNIINKLNEVDENGNALIDLVLVILDGGSRDLGTSYELINKVIIPNFGEGKADRILVAINQADMAMKGRNWDYEMNEPNQQLKDFLEEKVCSVKKRVFEATGVEIDPIYYCAGYKEEGGEQNRPYNLSKLLYYIVKATPSNKRVIYANNINRDAEMWKDDDEIREYTKETQKSILDSISDGIFQGIQIGEKIGATYEPGGKVIGGIICGIVGGVAGFIGHIFG